MDLGDNTGSRRSDFHAGLDRRKIGRLIPDCRGRATIVRYGRLGGRPEVVEVASDGKIFIVMRTGLPADTAREGRGKGGHGDAGDDGFEWYHCDLRSVY